MCPHADPRPLVAALLPQGLGAEWSLVAAEQPQVPMACSMKGFDILITQP